MERRRFYQVLVSATLLWLSSSSFAMGQAVVEDGPLAEEVNRSTDSKTNPVTGKSEPSTFNPLSNDETQAVAQITATVRSTEWLGAMAPVALSPFFGLTCLSGIAIAGDDYLPKDHFLSRTSSPLKQPLVFATFLVLTLVTSFPKFSKVSKPFAQAVDQLEAYSAIIILLVIRYLGSGEAASDQVAVVYQAGIFEFSAESLLWIATAINIIVINTVKFFFEVLVWITPIPTLDAIFETCNKGACAVLMAIYAFSPFVATLLNLAILVACLFVFKWVKRREVYYRTILIGFLRDILKRDAAFAANGLTVFPCEEFRDIPALSRCQLAATETGWRIRYGRLFRSPIIHEWDSPKPTVRCGLFANELSVGTDRLKFSRRHNRKLNELCDHLRLEHPSASEQEEQLGTRPIAVDLG